jgi:DNA-binding CsgD family transcriptional regulator/GAF domain-containing protein
MSEVATDQLSSLDTLLRCRDEDDLGRRFLTHARRSIDRPMLGVYLFDRETVRPGHISTENVSDAFLTRYEHVGRSIDPVLAEAVRSRAPHYNLDDMSLEDWRRTTVYERAAHVHRFAQVVIAPIVVDGDVQGTVNVGDADDERRVTPAEMAVVERLARELALALGELRLRERLRRAGRVAWEALDAVPAALAITRAGEAPRLNAAGRALLGDEEEAEAVVYDLLSRPQDEASFTREASSVGPDGEPLRLRGFTRPVSGEADAWITTIEPVGGARADANLPGLTPREREIAALVAEDLSDAEIAAAIQISRHTVRQHLKGVYRKLGVRTRVGLTRRLLAGPAGRGGAIAAARPTEDG